METGVFFNPAKRPMKGEKIVASRRDEGFRRKKVVEVSALLTVPESAKYLGVGRRKIYELIEWGELKAVKLGRAIQIEKESLDRFRESGKLT